MNALIAPYTVPCAVATCAALARAGSRRCAIHDRYDQATGSLTCARCGQAIRTGTWYSSQQHDADVVFVHAKRCVE
jgi:hypothetical protein